MAFSWLAPARLSGSVGLVLVVVVVMGRVPVPVMGVVQVVAVRHGLMPAAGLVRVRVASMGQMRQRMFVVVIVMRCVRMALVHIVNMGRPLNHRLPPARPLLVLARG